MSRDRPAALSDTAVAQARTMKSTGASTSEVVKEFGISRSTVYRCLNSSDGSRRVKWFGENVPGNSGRHNVGRVHQIEASW
ncbi:helix-turn-helix domain-containing protein [Rhodococcus sp. KBS0724]|uniref:helix-turn-helix domain-containing protein n=1 Tax=Rhodococcus sp. KBS0724 TaxID=1179674 RepID=UPI00163DA75C